MKKLSLALAALALCGGANAAGLVNAPFEVTVSFTSACKLTTSPTTIAFTPYTALSGTPSTLGTPADFVFSCSRGTSNTAVFGIVGGNGGLFASAGLHYVLAVGNPVVLPGNAALVQIGANAIGTAETLTVTVTGSIADQAGINNSAVGTGDSDNRVLRVTF